MEIASATVSRLSQKEKEMVAVAASLGAGCMPCTEHHARAVREAGASEDEARCAAEIGLAITRESLARMTALAAEHLPRRHDPGRPEQDELAWTEEPLAALIAVGAATAAHCVPALEREITRARRLRASEDDLRRAIGIGQTVRGVGARKTDAQRVA